MDVCQFLFMLVIPDLIRNCMGLHKGAGSLYPVSGNDIALACDIE